MSRRRQGVPEQRNRRNQPYWEEHTIVPSRQRPRSRREYYDYDERATQDDFYDKDYRRPRPATKSRRRIADKPTYNGQQHQYEEEFDYNYRDRRDRSRRKSNNQRNHYHNDRPYPLHKEDNPIHKKNEKKATTKEKIILSIFFNLIFYSFTIGILAMSLMFAFSNKDNATIFGYRFYTVKSNSMAPQKDSPPGGFYAGDIVLVQAMNGKDVKAGDIITFSVGNQGSYLTHRLVTKLDELNDKKGDYLITKGDANNTNDPPIEAKRVFGKVVYTIPKTGIFVEFIRDVNNLWLIILFVLSSFGFFMVLKAYLFSDNYSKSK